MDRGMSADCGHFKRKNGYSTHTGISRLEVALPCACGCFIHSTGIVLAQPRGVLDHPIASSNRKLSLA
jgi:hypothetical protein